MQLQDWVQRYGVVVGPEFLRVDGFLNHRIDPKSVSYTHLTLPTICSV